MLLLEHLVATFELPKPSQLCRGLQRLLEEQEPLPRFLEDLLGADIVLVEVLHQQQVAISAGYLFGLAYLASLVTYQVAVAMGAG